MSSSFRLAASASSFVRWSAALALAAPPLTAAPQQIQVEGPLSVAWSSRIDEQADGNEGFNAIVERNGVTYAVGYATGLAGSARVIVSARHVASGALAWEAELPIGFTPFPEARVGCELSADGGALFVAHDALSPTSSQPVGAVSRFDASTGLLVSTWYASQPNSSFSALALSPDGARVFVSGQSSGLPAYSSIACFDAHNGAELWSSFSLALIAQSVHAELVADPTGARVYESRDSGTVAAYDAASGAQLWSKVGSLGLAVSNAGTRVYTGGASATIVALDAATGVQLASSAIDILGLSYGVVDVVVDASDRVYALSTTVLGPRVRAFDAQFAPLWNVDWFDTFPFLVPTDLEVGGDAAVYAVARAQPGTPQFVVRKLDASSGAKLWTSAQQPLPGTPLDIEIVRSAAADTLCVAARRTLPDVGTQATRFDLAGSSGTLLGAHDTGVVGSAMQHVSDAGLSPDGTRLIAAGSIIDGAYQAEVQALSSVDGAQQWSRSFPGLVFDSGLGHTPQRFLALSSNRVIAQFGQPAAQGDGFAANVIHALLPANGATLWQASAPGFSPQTSDVIESADETRVFSSGIDPATSALLLRAYHAQSGALSWGLAASTASSAYVLRPRLVALPGGADFAVGYTLAGNPNHMFVERRSGATGAVQWQATAPLVAGELGAVLAELVSSADGTRLYAAGQVTLFQAPSLDRVVALDALNGVQLWQSDSQVGLGISSRVAVSPNGQYVAVGRDGLGTAAWRARVIDTAHGALVWNHDLASASGATHVGGLKRLAFDATSSKLNVSGTQDAGLGVPTSFASAAYASRDGDELWSVAYSTGLEGAADAAGLALAVSGTRLYAIGETTAAATGSDVVALALDLPALVGTPSSLSLASGGEQQFDLAPGAAYANDFAWLLGSASGTTPGFSVGNVLVPLNQDAYFQFTLANPNTGVLHGSLGQLDASAHGAARFALPAASDPALAGIVGQHAYVVIDGAMLAVTKASNAVSLALVP